MDLKLRTPFTMTVAGPSGCGKTELVLNLVKHSDEVFAQKFSHIWYFYGMYQDQVKQFEEMGVNVTPEMTEIHGDGAILCIFDDLMLERGKQIANFFTKMRHANVSTIFLSQSFYFDDKYIRLITRNSHYIVLFKCPRDASLPQTLGRQIFPYYKNFLPEAFALATANPYSYLFLDMKPDTLESFRVRQGILPYEQKVVYQHKY